MISFGRQSKVGAKRLKPQGHTSKKENRKTGSMGPNRKDTRGQCQRHFTKKKKKKKKKIKTTRKKKKKKKKTKKKKTKKDKKKFVTTGRGVQPGEEINEKKDASGWLWKRRN